MVRAIIFDCFGVLATEGWLPFVEQHFPVGSPEYQHALDLSRATDSGLIDYDDFIHAVAEMTQTSEPDVRQQIDHSVPNRRLCEYIKEKLKPSHKIGMLSNAGANLLLEIFDAQQIALFDSICLSYAIGFVKPQREAYEYVSQQLGVENEACIFIDDQQRHCEGARAVGMQAIQYQSLGQLEEDLERLLSDSKDEPPVSSH